MAPRGNPLPAARSILLVLASSRLAAPQEFESIISVPSEEVPCPPYSPECANTWPGTADVGDPCVAECNANPDDNPPTRWCPSEVGGGSAPSTPWGWCPQNPDPGPGPAEVFPGAQWEVREPEQEGMSTALLERAIEYAAGENNLRSHCVSIHRNGYLVAEKVWDRPLQPPSDYNSTTMVFSISKAITSTLVGMAERDGLLSTEGRLPEYGIPQWAGTEQGEITVDMLLRHDSGREYINDIEDIALPQFAPAGTDPSGQTEFSINNRSQQHRPGTYTQYNQMAFQLLERVLRNATGLQVPTLAKQQLWNPLQFESQTFWQETGVVSGIRNGPLLYAGVHTSCRDLARFGTLWMHRGTWGRTAPNGTNTTEEFFTPEFWAKAMSNGPRNARPYHWFQSGDMHRADGMGGQFVSFSPGAGLVITRIGHVLDEWVESFSPSQFINLVLDAVTDLDSAAKTELWDYALSHAEENAPDSVNNPDAERKLLAWLHSHARGDHN